jgi:alkyl hydroperoxide reductase subunit AhpC
LEALWQKYKSRNVQVLIIDVKESKEITAKWAAARKFTFPVLLDTDGKVSASYAPADVLPDLARDEVCVASNLIIDPDGKIQFFSLLDSKAFDAKLIALTKRLEALFLERKSQKSG